MKYYKIKNGNETLEHTVSESLSRIEKQLETRQNSIISCIFSSLIANMLGKCFQVENAVLNNIFYIFILCALYVIFLKCFQLLGCLGKCIKNKLIDTNEDYVDQQELSVKGIFYHKISNEIVQGISLVSKVKKIEKTPNTAKEDLIIIYSYQAKHCFEEVARMLNKTIMVGNPQKELQYCQVIGIPALIWACEVAIKNLRELKSVSYFSEREYMSTYFGGIEGATRGYKDMLDKFRKMDENAKKIFKIPQQEDKTK